MGYPIIGSYRSILVILDYVKIIATMRNIITFLGLFASFIGILSGQSLELDWALQQKVEAGDIITLPNGNIITGGFFVGTVDFDPGVNVFNLIGQGSERYIQVLDSAGDFLWAKKIAGRKRRYFAFNEGRISSI